MLAPRFQVLYKRFLFLGLSSSFTEFVKGLGAFERVAPFLSSTSKCSSEQQNFPKPPIPFGGAIRLESIQFSYPEKENQITLKSNSCILAIPGKITAILGASGCGKSTLIALLLQLYPLTSGKIILDNNYLLRSADSSWFKSHISIVPQEPVLFQDSIANNILYGNQNASFDEIKFAAELANVNLFIESLPEEYNTVVGERGCSLSGGQKQRIAIARALLRNSPVLILDEPTSALDGESEKIIHETLLKLAKKGKAIIIITHKESTMEIAHRKVQIHNQQIEELKFNN